MITKPIIVLGAPRSGTTILTRCLALHPDLWHLPGESHSVLEGPFHPAKSGYQSNRVTAEDLSDAVADQLRTNFYHGAINLNQVISNPAALMSGIGLTRRGFNKLAASSVGKISERRKPESIRLLEKTPKNALRVPMLARLFPDALFIWLKRRAADNIDSLIDGWNSVDRFGPVTRQRFARAGYPISGQLALQDYKGKRWKFALVPGWRDLKGKMLADVAAWQYYQCNLYALDDLSSQDSRRVSQVQYEDFVQSPLDVVQQIFQWADLPSSKIAEDFARRLPPVNATSTPRRGLRYEPAVSGAIERLPTLRPLQSRLDGYRGSGIGD